MVMVRALLMSPWVSVTPMVGAMWVSQASGVGPVGGGGVAGSVTVDGVADIDGGCWFWVWVRARAVVGLLCALLAGLPADSGDVYRLFVLPVLGGRSWRRVISLVGVLRVLLQGLGVGKV